MENKEEIPCAACQSWKKEQKKFSCNPDNCKVLTAWLFEKAPRLSTSKIQMQMQLPVPANQYVV
jgi:hypothetical protein